MAMARTNPFIPARDSSIRGRLQRESCVVPMNGPGSLLSRRRRAWLCDAFVALCACFVVAAPAIAAPDALGGRTLLAALKSGGFVLYFRHASTDFGQNDDQMTGYENCARQRNLTDAGRAEARAIGSAIKRLGVPVGDVLASPFCRTMETAQLIFDRAVATPAVRGGPASAPAERYTELRRLLATAPPAATNIAIVSHGNPFRAISSEPYLAEGEAAVIRPLGNDQFHIVARIPKDGWDALASP
jgi:phosphohistidine phosphatase SixA